MPRWVWVVDTTTGHRMDVDERSLRHGLEPLNDPRYPDLVGPLAQPRRPKHWVGKDGRPQPYTHGESRFDDVPEVGAAEAAPDPVPAGPGAAATARRSRRTTTSPATEPADTTNTKE